MSLPTKALISCVVTVPMFSNMKKGFLMTWIIHMICGLMQYTLPKGKNIGNEFIGTTFNKSFKA